MIQVTTVTHETIDQFLLSLYAKGKSENTRKAYGTDLLVFLNEQRMPVTRETYELQAMTWLTNHRQSLSPKTSSRRLTSLRAFARWARIEVPDLLEYSGPTPLPGQPHPLPEGIEGVRKLITYSRLPHHGAFIALCGLCGLRAGEALAVKFTDFDFNAMNLTVRGKGEKMRTVPVSPEAWDVLAMPVARSFTEGIPTVVGLHDRFARKLVTDLGVKANLQRHIKSHDLRATFATAVYNKTGDMRLVQILLGHADIQTTQIYVDIARSAMREAVQL